MLIASTFLKYVPLSAELPLRPIKTEITQTYVASKSPKMFGSDPVHLAKWKPTHLRESRIEHLEIVRLCQVRSFRPLLLHSILSFQSH